MPLLRVELDRKDLKGLGLEVITENYKKKVSGRGKRQWNTQFTELERKRFDTKLYPLFYNWCYIKGLPDNHIFEFDTDIELIQRAANFFGGI